MKAESIYACVMTQSQRHLKVIISLLMILSTSQQGYCSDTYSHTAS